MGALNLSPATLSRLSTKLPEKYPGRDIVFWTGGFDLSGRISLARPGRWPIEAAVDISRSGPYRRSGRYIRDSLGFSVRIGT
jgi:hypothetical protein